MDASRLSYEEVQRAEANARERASDKERRFVRKVVARKIPRLLRKAQRKIDKGESATVQVIVPDRMDDVDREFLAATVNKMLITAGAEGLCYAGLGHGHLPPLPFEGRYTLLRIAPISTR